MALGVPTFDPTLSRQAMSMQSDLLQGLGNQIKQDIATVVTNRQLKGLAQGLQSVDTTSPQFGRQIVGLMSEYPMAVQSPIGQAAITQLGAEFRLNRQEQLRAANPYRPIPGTDAVLNSTTGEVQPLPPGVTRQKPTAISRNTVALRNPDGTVQSVEEFGLPMPTITDPLTIEEAKQANRLELQQARQAGNSAANPQIRALNTQLNGAMTLYMKKDAEAARLESMWNNTPGDSKEKQALGLQATALRDEAKRFGIQVENIKKEIDRTIQPSAPINQLGAAAAVPVAAPAGIPGLPVEVVESDILIPPELTAPSNSKAPPKMRYVGGQLIIP